MDIAQALGDLVAAKQKEVDTLNAVIAEVNQPKDESADLSGLKAQVDALVKERDALRAAIQTEVDDKKADTARLEKAIAPVEVAPVPEVPVETAPAEEAPVESAPEAEAQSVAEDVEPQHRGE